MMRRSADPGVGHGGRVRRGIGADRIRRRDRADRIRIDRDDLLTTAGAAVRIGHDDVDGHRRPNPGRVADRGGALTAVDRPTRHGPRIGCADTGVRHRRDVA